MPVRVRFAAVAALALVVWGGPALGQAHNPFGVGISEGGGSPTGLTGWLLSQQGWFEHQLSLGVRVVRTDSAALWWLMGIGFVYGVFHAAGPGHGKTVLASYMIANERALRRGIVLSLLAALLQGAVAVGLVGLLTLVLHATAQHMKDVASIVEMVSFAGVACLGAWLVWRKGSAFAEVWRKTGPDRPPFAYGGYSIETGLGSAAATGSLRLAFVGAPVTTAEPRRFVCTEAAAPDGHAPGCFCHAVDPALLGAARLSWREAGLTVLAAGARPCSGAILVLVFASVQGVFLAGMVSVLAMSIGVAITTGALAIIAVLGKGIARRLVGRETPKAALLLSGLELLAAVVVLLVGAALLAGSAVTS